MGHGRAARQCASLAQPQAATAAASTRLGTWLPCSSATHPRRCSINTNHLFHTIQCQGWDGAFWHLSLNSQNNEALLSSVLSNNMSLLACQRNGKLSLVFCFQAQRTDCSQKSSQAGEDCEVDERCGHQGASLSPRNIGRRKCWAAAAAQPGAAGPAAATAQCAHHRLCPARAAASCPGQATGRQRLEQVRVMPSAL